MSIARHVYTQFGGTEIPKGSDQEVPLTVTSILNRNEILASTTVRLDFQAPTINVTPTLSVVELNGISATTRWPFNKAGIGARLELSGDITGAHSIEISSPTVTLPTDFFESAGQNIIRIRSKPLSENLISDGEHQFTLLAADEAGNVTSIDLGTINFDLTRPQSPDGMTLKTGCAQPSCDTQVLRINVANIDQQSRLYLGQTPNLDSANLREVNRPQTGDIASTHAIDVDQNIYAIVRDDAGNYSDASTSVGIQLSPLRIQQSASFNLDSHVTYGSLRRDFRLPSKHTDYVSYLNNHNQPSSIFVPEGIGASKRPHEFDNMVWAHSHNKIFALRNNQTWTFDGNTWTQLQDLAPCSQTKLAFDRRRQLTVAICNYDSGVLTFEHDGQRWREIQTPTKPPWGYLAYDPKGQRIVTIGSSHTWYFDGTNWLELTPSPRETIVEYLEDQTNLELSVFTRLYQNSEIRTWILESDHWRQASRLPSSEGSRLRWAVHHEAEGQSIIWLDRNFRYYSLKGTSSSGWQIETQQGSGPLNFFDKPVYDGHRQTLVQFSSNSDTFFYQNGAWLMERNAQLNPPYYTYLVRDSRLAIGPNNDICLLDRAGLNEYEAQHLIWCFDGVSWRVQAGPKTPVVSFLLTQETDFVYDPRNDRWVVHDMDSNYNSWTGIYDNATSQSVILRDGPQGYSAMTYDSTNERVVLYANRHFWILEGRQWREIPSGPLAVPFLDTGDVTIFDDPQRNQVVAVGPSIGTMILRDEQSIYIENSELKPLSTSGSIAATEWRLIWYITADPSRNRLIQWPNLHEYREGSWHAPTSSSVMASFRPEHSVFRPQTNEFFALDNYGGLWSYTNGTWQAPINALRAPHKCLSIVPDPTDGGFWCYEAGHIWKLSNSSWTKLTTTTTPTGDGHLSWNNNDGTLELVTTTAFYKLINNDWVIQGGVPNFRYSSSSLVLSPQNDELLLIDGKNAWQRNSTNWSYVSTSTVGPFNSSMVRQSPRTKQIYSAVDPKVNATNFEWLNNSWSTTSTGPIDDFFDPLRGLWVDLIGDSALEYVENNSISRERVLGSYFYTRQDDLVQMNFDPNREVFVQLQANTPFEQRVLKDRRLLKAGMQREFTGLRLTTQALQVDSLQIEIQGQGTSMDGDSNQIDQLELWLWNWQTHNYETVDLPANVAQSRQSIVISDFTKYLAPNGSVNAAIQTAGQFGLGPVPSIQLDYFSITANYRIATAE